MRTKNAIGRRKEVFHALIVLVSILMLIPNHALSTIIGNIKFY